MAESGEIWGLVLAAGDGKRLSGWSRDCEGRPAPKQFCPLGGRRTLLEDTWKRLGWIVPRRRIVTVVAEAHRSHWSRLRGGPPEENLVVQPANRGTAAGILLPLLEILDRDPHARVVICPSDQGVRDERGFAVALTRAMAVLERPVDRLLLLGVTPESPDGEYGWIVPGATSRDGESPASVARFVEKPGPEVAAKLAGSGAVWNSFWTVGRARTIEALFQERQPELLNAVRETRRRALGEGAEEFAARYAAVPDLDFSRDLLQGSEEKLGLLLVPACGWTDLGTPERLQSYRRGSLRTGASRPRPARVAELALAGGRRGSSPRAHPAVLG